MESWECATLVYEEEKKKGNSSLPFFLNFAPVFLSPPKAKQPIAMALTFGPPRPSSRYSMSSRQKGVQIWGENDESFVFFHSQIPPSPLPNSPIPEAFRSGYSRRHLFAWPSPSGSLVVRPPAHAYPTKSHASCLRTPCRLPHHLSDGEGEGGTVGASVIGKRVARCPRNSTLAMAGTGGIRRGVQKRLLKELVSTIPILMTPSPHIPPKSTARAHRPPPQP